jgi:hypothetical protein
MAADVAITPATSGSNPAPWPHRLKTTTLTRTPNAPTVPNFAASWAMPRRRSRSVSRSLIPAMLTGAFPVARRAQPAVTSGTAFTAVA